MIPVLATAGLGFLWAKYGRAWDSASLTPLVVDIGTPCLIFATFTKTSISPASFATIALASVTALIAFSIVGALFLLCARLPLRTFLPALSFPNNGNLGLPLALYAFGQEGLGYAIVFYSICMVAQFTAGQAIAAGGANWRGFLRMPLLYAVALGMIVSVFQVPLPHWFSNTIVLIGGMTIPLMLLMLGASLARLHAGTGTRAVLLSAWRIGAGAAIGVAIATAFGLEGSARAVLILQCAMPPAVYNYLFAQRWNNQPEEVASVIVVATVVSILTVPILLYFLIS